MLDSRFFERITTAHHNGSALESYKAVYTRSTMVLFSRRTRTPLAALTLKADDVGCLSMLTGRPSPGKAKESYFQGMLNLPDQTFSFVISNLSDKGMINFNILHTPHRVSEVDPGPSYGVNQVNELHQNQSYTIEADQRNNRKMILAGKTKIVKDPITSAESEVAVTVKETEEAEKPTGLYFYLSVVADKACKELVNRFAEGTVWKVVPGFVRQVARPPPPHPAAMPDTAGPTQTASSYSGGSTTHRSWQQGFPGQGMAGQAVLFRQRQARGGQWRARIPIIGAFSSAVAELSNDTNRMSLEASSSFPGRSRQLEESESAHFWRSSQGRESPVAAELPQRHAALESIEPAPARFVGSVDVGSTQAAELKYGRQVNVHSHFTGHDYAYEHCSDPTVLCMSFWKGMKFLALPDITKELEDEVQDWVKNQGKNLIESLNAVFKSETCVIDLESKADTIICTCGHQCINHSNVSDKLHQCPLCRSPIVAFVKADSILVD